MQTDDIIVTHAGKEWLVEGDKLVSFREVDVEWPTPESVAEAISSLRRSMCDYIAKNDPYSKN